MGGKELETRKEIRKTAFAGWNILHAMDLNGGTLNYVGIEILRSLETDIIMAPLFHQQQNYTAAETMHPARIYSHLLLL
eukprot:scaffold106447_cov57-Attheya_sp.AAC.1